MYDAAQCCPRGLGRHKDDRLRPVTHAALRPAGLRQILSPVKEQKETLWYIG